MTGRYKYSGFLTQILNADVRVENINQRSKSAKKISGVSTLIIFNMGMVFD